MSTQAPHWRFRRMAPGEINENPVQGEFFSSTSDLPGRLVREAVQNSLDAALNPQQPVRMRFAFSGDRYAIAGSQAAPYLTGLQDHIDAIADDERRSNEQQAMVRSQTQSVAEGKAIYRAANLIDGPMSYLVVEDFGTKGLTGDIEANGAREEGNNFWGFFRQIGISPKGENEAGSWGLGKWVFPDASDVNALLAFTRRAGEQQTLMMGLATLKTHTIEEHKYKAYGHFVRADERDDHTWKQMPLATPEHTSFIEQACRDFGLQRGRQSGLSVVVPWPHQELTPSSIARAVVTQYFLPIILGRLEVAIEHPDESPRLIDRHSLRAEMGRLPESEDAESNPSSMLRLLDLAEWAYQQSMDTGHIQIPTPTRGYNALTETGSGIDIDDLRRRYADGERLAFELSLDVQRAGAIRSSSVGCCVYLQRDDDLTRGQDYYVRGYLNIQGMDLITNLKARSLLLVDGDSELGHLLRDAENPAHTDWKARDKAKQNWESVGRVIEQVRLAPRRLLQALSERPAGRQLDALADLFPARLPAGSGSTPRRAGSNGAGTDPPGGPPISRPSPLKLQQTAGGFSLVPNNPFPLSVVGTTWTVKFAYELARGSKKRAFSLFAQGVKDGVPDFSLRRGLKREQEGCDSIIEADNELRVSIFDDHFKLSVRGFDLNRDVLVEVDLDAPAESDDANDRLVESNASTL